MRLLLLVVFSAGMIFANASLAADEQTIFIDPDTYQEYNSAAETDLEMFQSSPGNGRTFVTASVTDGTYTVINPLLGISEQGIIPEEWRSTEKGWPIVVGGGIAMAMCYAAQQASWSQCSAMCSPHGVLVYYSGICGHGASCLCKMPPLPIPEDPR